MRRALLFFTLLLGACASGTETVDDPESPDVLGPPPVPGWTCAAARYDAGDGCDCECGAPDPDCAKAEAKLVGCDDYYFVAPYCSTEARCEDHCLNTPVEGTCTSDGQLAICFVGTQEPELRKQACPPGSVCHEDPFGAKCIPTGECIDGTTMCASDTTLRTCSGGTWLTSNCAPGVCSANPGSGAVCTAGTSAVSITGRLRYQFRDRNAAMNGYGALAEADAAGLIAVVTDGATTLGSAVLGADGSFSVPVSSTPSASAKISFFASMENATGKTIFTVGRATAACRASSSDCTSTSTSGGPWSWSVNLTSRTAIGTVVITEENGSGAVHIFEWMRYGLNRVRTLYGDSIPRTLVAMWEPSMGWDCGACFMNWPATMGSSYYDTSIVIGGEASSPTQWSKSVIMHELGHWVMATYSKTPNEGGQHFVLQQSRPGLAWSEGFASYFGQTSISEREGAADPIYFDVQTNGSFWIDIEEVDASSGNFVMPSLDDPMDQYINEFVVSSMLWDLGDPASTGDPSAMGHQKVHAGIRTARIRGSLNRGYSTVDLVDFLDGVLCDALSTSGPLSGVIRTLFEFPYDNAPLCSGRVEAPYRLDVRPRPRAGGVDLEVTVRAHAPGSPPLMLVVEPPAGVRVAGLRGMVAKAGEAQVFALEGTPTRPVRVSARTLPHPAFGAALVAEYPEAAHIPPRAATPLSPPIHFAGQEVTETVLLD